MCPRDNAKLFCSGHGHCVYDATIDANPYCVCEHYDNAGDCAAAGLYLHDAGACAYYDARLGFDSCFKLGLCGICQDAARGAFGGGVAAGAALAALAVMALTG
jgi:hypothetical protein